MSIEFINISKKYGKFWALKDINLKLQKGKINILIGTSGSGKTTLLKLINRLIDRDSGEILINNKKINDIDVIELRKSMGYVVQEIGLFPHYTVYENIAVVPKLLKWDEEKIKNRVCELLEMVNLDPERFMDKYPRELSGGQKQRIGVARGLASDPEIILMDEPFGAIDPINREELQNSFLEIQKKIKKTIVFVTHDIREALKLGDYITVMNKGIIEGTGKKEDIIKETKNSFIKDILGDFSYIKYLEFMNSDNKIEEIKRIENQNNVYEDKQIVYSDFSENYYFLTDREEKFVGYLKKEEFNKNMKNLKKDFIDESSNLLEALNKMIFNKETMIPVLNNKKLIGVLRFESIIE
ncbi:ABC transporter ATP-binding protein [Haliovirga abyssi]|uniref:Proline/glycine betaine ABC transporter ATP-binding protein n=1 Tax=Haliovirga abyssi TaxID=2996794 RepID=A0AAU9DEE7_9FUSO|nr:ABC transporter ATP-binding protein [Haliovirga abyssi]BDU49702.1 proline/glycine betaine ABC transporter ATP-binding protein [Haliovirga abyssi]